VTENKQPEYTILIADDSELDLMYAEQVLKSYNEKYQILLAHDGLELCQRAIEEYPDLILSDIEMPEMNGIDAITFLKNNFRTKNIPIIVFTATDTFQEAFDAGAIDFIEKPFKEESLIVRVKSALNLVKSYRAIEKQKIEIEKRNHKIKHQHENVLKQKNIISQKNEEITADLRYSKRIQNAILPSDKFINEVLSQYFIVNIPKNIVSGDFYWLEKSNNKLIITVADCTGHGVSGALMHMMGIVFLNQIVKKKDYENSGEILEELREYVITSLHQTGKFGEAQDGMDLALCIIDFDTLKLKFSGANNPLYIINNREFKEIKGDRMPVGINVNYEEPFKTHEIQLEKGDTLYMFTDGYADQFGGPKGKKFRYKFFKELLISINGTSLKRQKDIVEQTFYKWKGNYEQVDDVLVMGIKV
jgi:serine phosphatase RsbU (regulator of sigma subunit)